MHQRDCEACLHARTCTPARTKTNRRKAGIEYRIVPIVDVMDIVSTANGKEAGSDDAIEAAPSANPLHANVCVVCICMYGSVSASTSVDVGVCIGGGCMCVRSRARECRHVST